MALSLAGLVLFIACKKSDNPNPNPQKTDSTAGIPDSVTIIGKWSVLRSAVYFYNSSGVFMDSASTVVGPKDYYEFLIGGVAHFHEDDGSSAYPFTDTLSYRVVAPKNIVFNGKDTASYKLTKNTKDTLLLSSIVHNTTDFYGKPADGYDSILLVK